MYHHEPPVPTVMRNNLVHHRFSLFSAYLLTGSVAEELHLVIIPEMSNSCLHSICPKCKSD